LTLNQVAGFDAPVEASGDDAGVGEGLGLAPGVSSAIARETIPKKTRNGPKK
jgi:hypothetical protein